MVAAARAHLRARRVLLRMPHVGDSATGYAAYYLAVEVRGAKLTFLGGVAVVRRPAEREAPPRTNACTWARRPHVAGQLAAADSNEPLRCQAQATQQAA